MTNQLQAASETETATPVEGSDLATDTGENQEEKITFSDEQQKVFDEAIGKKTFKQRQQQREFGDEKADLQSQIAELQAKIPKDTRPTIPPVPDSLDDDFDQQMQARDESIRKAEAYDVRQTLATEQTAAAALQTQNDEAKAINEAAATFNQNATKLGIKPEDLQSSGLILQQMGITNDLTMQLLREETGPLMTSYLSANPDVFDQLNTADQWSAGVILIDVRLKAAEMKPQLTAAPAPANVLTGGGATTKERGPKGATYE